MFNPQQKHMILAKMGYNGPSDDKAMEQFVASNPAAAAKIGKFENAAKKIMTPPPQMQMAEGGDVNWDPTDPTRIEGGYTSGVPDMKTMMNKLTGGKSREEIGEAAYNDLFVKASQAMHGVVGENKDTRDWNAIMNSDDPLAAAAAATKDMYKPSVVETVNPETGEPMFNVVSEDGTVLRAGFSSQEMAEQRGAELGVEQTTSTADATTGGTADTGDATSTTSTAGQAGVTGTGNTTLAKSTEDYMSTVPEIEAHTPLEKTTVGSVMEGEASQIAEGTGDIEGDVETVEAETVEAQQADAPEAVDAITYDPTKVSGEVAAELEKLKAAQGQASEKATVRGQLALLMQDFDDGTPPWASGAMRSAMASMAARGLGASSMAGAAVVQAAMEAALPIAGQDAKTQAAFEMKNLDNRQQTRIFKTQQKIASLLSDQAAENAAKNFNAQSQNQVNMFNENLSASVQQFNASQVNAIRQFNAGETNALNKFNSEMKEQRAQFEAKNDVLIQQANVQFRNDMFKAKMQTQADLDIAGAQISSQEKMKEMALEADRKMKAAALAQQAAQSQLAREQQSEQAALERAFQAEQGRHDRALTVLTTTMAAETQKLMAQMASKDSEKAGIGNLIGTVLGLAF